MHTRPFALAAGSSSRYSAGTWPGSSRLRCAGRRRPLRGDRGGGGGSGLWTSGKRTRTEAA